MERPAFLAPMLNIQGHDRFPSQAQIEQEPKDCLIPPDLRGIRLPKVSNTFSTACSAGPRVSRIGSTRRLGIWISQVMNPTIWGVCDRSNPRPRLVNLTLIRMNLS